MCNRYSKWFLEERKSRKHYPVFTLAILYTIFVVTESKYTDFKLYVSILIPDPHDVKHNILKVVSEGKNDLFPAFWLVQSCWKILDFSSNRNWVICCVWIVLFQQNPFFDILYGNLSFKHLQTYKGETTVSWYERHIFHTVLTRKRSLGGGQNPTEGGAELPIMIFTASNSCK